MALINRAGIQALTPEQAAPPPKQRHPQSGKFIRKGTVGIKKSGSKKVKSK